MINQLSVRHFVLSCIFLLFFSGLHANTYYFSSTSGDDLRSAVAAQNPATPWKTIDKLNAVFSQLNAGDVVLFKTDDVFYGTINVSKSGSSGSPIVFSSYGTGARPEITGFSSPSGWSNLGGNIWEADLPAAQSNVNSVLVNSQFQRIGRYPNASVGYLTIQSASGNNSITDPQLANGNNWAGGEIVIRKERWVLDRNQITQHQGSVINYISQSHYWASAGYGYFIQNHPKTLDQDGEWYYLAANKRFGIYSASDPSTRTVRASTVKALVNLNGQTNISFTNLSFSGANENAFNIRLAQNIQIANCNILYSGNNAINADTTGNLQILNCTITNSGNIALNVTNCNNAVIKGNAINKSGSVAGLGGGDSGSYEAILQSGNDATIEANTIDSTGYVPVTFSGNNIIVKNNLVTNFAFVKDDGAGIYTWNNGSNAPINTGRQIIGNIILNGLGAGAGTPDPSKQYATGIYMDDNSGGVSISDNTVGSCSNYGIYIHNAHEIEVKNNTVYNNRVQLEVTHDDLSTALIRNILMTGNKFISKLPNQVVAEFKTNLNDITSFGTFDNNYYSRPFNDNLTIGVLYKENGNYTGRNYDLSGWKAYSGKDVNSKASPFNFSSYSVNYTIGSNQYSNGTFDANINGLYVYSNANNASANWAGGVLDGGALKVSFSGIAGNGNKANVVIGAGSITAGKKYLLRCSVKGTDENKSFGAYVRISGSPYSDLADRQYITLKSTRIDNQILITPTAGTSSASIGFEIEEQSSPVYIDNVQLLEADVSNANPDDSIQFVYNTDATSKNVSLNGTFADVANAAFSGNINLPAYSSAVLLKKSSSQPPVSVVCSATGTILLEQWNNIAGNDVSNIPLQTPPSVSSQLTVFEIPSNTADNYGTRIRGYICPPQTGNYTFWIAGDDASELWLSTDSTVANKTKIAYSLSWTGAREWNKYASQKSVSITLQAGGKYYVETLQKEGAGGDNLAVAWQLPDGTFQGPIPGTQLSPFAVVTAPVLTSQTISFAPVATHVLGDLPFSLSATATSGLPVTFRVVSGPATVVGSLVTITGTGTVVVEASQAGNAQYNAAPVVTQSFTINTSVVVSACSATGTILLEQWNNIAGNDVSNIPLQTPPSVSSQLTVFEIPTNTADNYGTRIRGYICPPQTGNYTFWIAGDDASELWLSTDSTVANKTKIAYSLSWTGAREWNKYASQKSVSITLQAGGKYYIETLQKEGAGGDNLAVAWQLPDGTFQGPIPGTQLSPFVVVTAPVLTSQTISFAPVATHVLGDLPFSLSATATSGLPVTFRVVSGPATVVGSLVTLTGTGTVVVEASQAGNAQYSAAPVVTQSFTVNTPVVVSCAGTGSIVREQWSNISGLSISSIPLQTTPTSTLQLTSFEAPENYDENYGARIRGYICPPQTGNYTFWIAADDAAELWLSNSDAVSGKVLIANVPQWTASRQWNKYPSQKSVVIYLQAGQRYYIEALQKEATGGDNLAVAWQLPDGTFQGPIPGNRLIPYTEPACTATGTILREQWNNIIGNLISSIPVLTAPAATSSLTSFESPVNVGDYYGARIRGYICAPQAGSYTFWIAADDVAELWLSSTSAATDKVKIATVPDWTYSREWNKYAAQKSVTVNLQAGGKYYIEALHKEIAGSDNLAVAWQLPDGTFQGPIPGTQLSPFVNNTATAKTTAVTLNQSLYVVPPATIAAGLTSLKVYPNPVHTSATIEVQLKQYSTFVVDLYDSNGRLLKKLLPQGSFKSLQQTIHFNAAGLAPGVYIVRLVTQNETVTQKISVR